MKQRLDAYLQLLRLPTVFTAMADICLGFLLTHDSFEPHLNFSMLLLSSSSLYLSGMVFNDVFDRQIDAHERPERPLPSGRVSLHAALRIGILLVLGGLGMAQLVGNNSMGVAVVLMLFIFAYDGLLKNTPLGPPTMGACRFLNVMLGASAVENADVLWALPQLHVATGLGIYIAGVTWFARQEARQSHRGQLLGALIVVNTGLCLLIAYLLHGEGHKQTQVLFVLAIIGLTINRRLVTAVFHPAPQIVQRAIKSMLMSLVMLDATLVLFVTGNAVYASATALLLVPAVVLGRWIRMT